jgi:hypothetical protein
MITSLHEFEAEKKKELKAKTVTGWVAAFVIGLLSGLILYFLFK